MNTVDFVLLDQSGGAPTTSGGAMDPGTLASIAAACEVFLNRDVAAHYGGAYRVRAGAGPQDIQPGEIVFALLPALPDAPGAIAYHDVNGVGVPVIYDAVPLSDTLTASGNSVSVAIAHELAETAGDPGCNRWAQGPSQEYAFELADAVEAQSYPVTTQGGQTVYVSNFVLPAFFVPNHAGPYDYMSTIGMNTAGPSAPLQTTSGGYQIVRSSGSNEQSVSAISSPARRMAKKRHWSSRTARRGLQLAP